MTQSLQWLNRLSEARAKAEFLKCCGSLNWARMMSEARPFVTLEDLLARANSLWQSMNEEDWLEAFRSHPKIGEQKASAAQSEQAQNWSKQEQSGTAGADTATRAALAAGNQEYEKRFGFIFIVCATGKASDEMLAILNSRLRNDLEAELSVAAEEQRKITRLRLEKLLNE